MESLKVAALRDAYIPNASIGKGGDCMHQRNPLRIAGLPLASLQAKLQGIVMSVGQTLEHMRDNRASRERTAVMADELIKEELKIRGIPGTRLPYVSRVSSEPFALLEYLIGSSRTFLLADVLSGMENYRTDVAANAPRVRWREDHWAISLAIVSGSDPIVAAAYIPLYELTLSAVRGTYLFINGQDMRGHLRKQSARFIEEIVPLVEWPWWGTPAERRALFIRAHTALEQCAYPQVLGAPVVSGSLVAAGRRDAVVLLGAYPWEQAAVGLLLREAGARVTRLGGGRWDVFSPNLLSASPATQRILAPYVRAYGPWRGRQAARIARLPL